MKPKKRYRTLAAVPAFPVSIKGTGSMAGGREKTMTREEAIHVVDIAFGVPQAVRRAGENRTYHEAEIRKAKALAIKALEHQRAGSWEWDSFYGGFYRCSACGYEQGRKTNYCPECGAHMVESEGAK